MGKRFNSFGALSAVCLGIILCVNFVGGTHPQLSDDDVLPLISRSDLYCPFFIWEGSPPEMRIEGWEREGEKLMLKDADVIYINKGSAHGLEEGSLLQVIEMGPKLRGYGSLAYRRGVARIAVLKEGESEAVLERICGSVRGGHYLIPFVEREGMLGKDLGFALQVSSHEGQIGRFLHFQDGNVHVASGQWALIDLGQQHGIEVGDQLVICKRSEDGKGLDAFGNLVVIDVQDRTSTVKILSCKDAVRRDDMVLTRSK